MYLLEPTVYQSPELLIFFSVEEVLPGRTILDKNVLPPIKSQTTNHIDPPAPEVADTLPSPRRLPKLEGRPPTILPFDSIIQKGM